MWPVTATRVAYENPWISVREDDVVRPDGTAGIYGVVTVRSPAVFVVAVTDADEVVLVTVDRHTSGPSLEVPAGGSDGGDLREAAARELAEETGLAARHWARIGSMNALNGICEAPEVVFLATGLHPAPDASDVAHEHAREGISAVQCIPWSEVLDLVATGRITDGESVAALFFAAIALRRVGPGPARSD